MLRLAAAVVLTLLVATPALAADPVVGVWYRGTPAGTPKQEELAVIRALGFNGVTWPAEHADGIERLKEMAKAVGLEATIVGAPKPVTPESLLTHADRFDLVVTPQNTGLLTALAWRAVAHGARTLAFDGGADQGAGLENADRSLKTWARSAIDMARQITANPRLVNSLRPGLGVIVAPDASPNLDLVMLDAERSWVLIATNTSAEKISATVRLPAGTPYANWLNLLDAKPLAMTSDTAGPRWDLKMDPRSARVYVVEKVRK